MQTDIEELTNEYGRTCAQAVRDAIHELANKWDMETLCYLNEQGYSICVELYDGNLSAYARIGKDDYFGPIKYENDKMNYEVQEMFDNLGFNVVLNAMLWDGLEDITQTIYWEIE